MSLQTIEIEAFSGPTSVLIGGGNQPTIVYINQGPAGSAGNAVWGGITGTLSSQTDLQDALDLKANLASPTFTGTVVLPSATSIGNVSATEIGYVDGVTSAIQTQLNAKAPLASPTFTGIVTAPRITGRCDGLEVLCKAGLAIAAGQVVYVTGASGNNIVIGLARANAEVTSSKTIGISESTLANNATGYVITEGLMTVSISAPTANEGDPIWLSPTTAGSMVFGLANKPSAPNHIVYLGVVTRKTGNTVVEIYVKIQNGSELDELSDVSITSPVAGQALMRGASLWENRALVSNDISDSSTGGNGAADAGKLVEFNATGGVSLAYPTFTGEVVINTLVGVNKDSLTINNTSNGDGQESYGLKINKSGVDSVGLQVEVLNVNDCRGIYSNVSGDTSTGLVSVANGVSSKGASINSSGYETRGLTITSSGSYSKGIVVESSGTENVGVEINSTVGDYHAKFRDAGTSKSFVARLNGAFGWFRGVFTGRIQAADTLTEDRTYTLPDASGTVALIDPSSGTQTFSGAQSFTGNVGIGTTSPSVKLHAIATTEQLRVGYDASNYLSTTVSSAGLVTLNAVGTSTGFVFSDKVTASSQGESKDLAQNDVITSQLHRSNLLFEGLRYVPYSPSLNSAGGTILAGNYGSINVDAGATTFRRMNLSQNIFLYNGTGGTCRFDHNFRIAVTGTFYIILPSLVEQRIYVGSQGSFALPFAGLGAYPANTRGYGFKVRQNPSTANQLQVAVFARDGTSAVAGTYIESGWVNFGVNFVSSSSTQAFVLEKIGTTVNLYGTDTRDNIASGGPRTRTPSTVIANVSGTGVPNDYAYVATNWSSVEAAIIGDGTTANTATNQNLLIRSGFMEIF